MNIKTHIKIFFIIFLPVIAFLFSIVANNASAAVSLPWSTTFNCVDWTMSSSTFYNVNCDGLASSGMGYCTDSTGTYASQITSIANDPNGLGGKGFRTYNMDGKDQGAGSLKVQFATQNELWIQWSMRYETGFKWSPGLYYDKWIYIDTGLPCAVVPEWYGSDYVNVWTACGQNYPSASGNGWNSIMGGSTSDGKFHAFKIHMKMDTNGSDGIAEMWVDSIKRISANNVNFGGGAGKTGWSAFIFESNQNSPGNGHCATLDFDDFVVSATDIGSITGGTTDTTPPSAPSGLVVN